MCRMIYVQSLILEGCFNNAQIVMEASAGLIISIHMCDRKMKTSSAQTENLT